MRALFDLHNPDGPERCGVILDDRTILEIPNIHPDPTKAFSMPSEALEAANVIASWHTHPTTTANLSVADYKAFHRWPRLRHYVVAATEIWCYGMSGDILVLCETITKSQSHDYNRPTRTPENPVST